MLVNRRREPGVVRVRPCIQSTHGEMTMVGKPLAQFTCSSYIYIIPRFADFVNAPTPQALKPRSRV